MLSGGRSFFAGGPGRLAIKLNYGIEHGNHRFCSRDDRGEDLLHVRWPVMLSLGKPHHRSPRVYDRCELLKHQFNSSSFVRRQNRLRHPLEGRTLFSVVISRPHAGRVFVSKQELLKCHGNGAADGTTLEEDLFIDVNEYLLT